MKRSCLAIGANVLMMVSSKKEEKKKRSFPTSTSISFSFSTIFFFFSNTPSLLLGSSAFLPHDEVLLLCVPLLEEWEQE